MSPAVGVIRELERHGARWRLEDPGGIIGAPIAGGRPYEWRLLDQIQGRHLEGQALDVGAHVGNHALFLAAVCGLKVWALEADPATFARLSANLELNPELEIHALNVAAGSANGRARIASRMRALPDPAGAVELWRLDDLLELEELVLVKIDVEGFEAEVLEGMVGHLERCRPLVYAETHTRTAGRAIAGVLEPIGYTSTGTVRMGSSMERWEAG